MNKYRIVFEGKTYEMEVELVSGNVAQPVKLDSPKPEKKPETSVNNSPIQKAPLNNGAVTSPIPGTIIKVNKSLGDSVKTGEVVLVLEAMKMENEVVAPADGTITKINAVAGKSVAGGELLFEIE